MSESKSTINHDEIKEWAEQRKGKPAIVEGTGNNDPGGIGLLRINFEGYDDPRLKDVSWDDFFETFDKKNLAFLYQDTISDEQTSRFFKFVDREKQ